LYDVVRRVSTAVYCPSLQLWQFIPFCIGSWACTQYFKCSFGRYSNFRI